MPTLFGSESYYIGLRFNQRVRANRARTTAFGAAL